MSGVLDIHEASAAIVSMLEEACKELATKGHDITPEDLLAIRQRQATGQVYWDDPPVTLAEAPQRTVMVRTGTTFSQQTFEREKTPGLSQLDSAVRKMRSAAYAYNEGDYTACYIMARESFLEVQAALKGKTYMETEVEVVPQPQIEESNG